jgi:hypothetical protein
MKEIRLKNGLEVDDIVVDGIDTKDFPDFSDAYICDALVFENGDWRVATAEELDELSEDSDLVYEAVENYLY